MALSSITRVADGIQSQFSFTFGYLSRSHVFLFVNNTLASYKWIGEFLLEPLVVPLPGDVVTIRRLTDRANRVTTYTDGQTLLAESLNAGDLQVFYIAQEMIDQIEEGIVAGDVAVLNPGTGYITAQWIQDQLTANLAAASQFAEIDAAILGEELARAQGLAAEAAARAAAIGAEAIARGAAITAEAATRTAEVLALTTDLEAEATARTADVLSLTAADAATVGRLSIVESDLNTPTTGVKAKLVTVENAVTTETSARASADTAILAEINTPGTGLKARATSLESRTTAVEANKAEASALSALSARVTTAEGDIDATEASIISEATTRATADTAISSSVTALTARVTTAEADINAAEAAIVTANTAIATETTARASADTAILAEINDPTTGLKARATSLESRTTNVEANKAEASALSALTARVTTAEGDINAAEASVVTETNARVTADNALSSSITALTSRVGVAEADIVSVENAIATETGARTTAVNALDARVGPVEAGLVTVNTAVSNLQTGKADVSTVTALTARVTTAESDINAAEAAIVSESAARVSADSAAATTVSNLQASFSGRQILNANPFFDEGPATTSGVIPPRWTNWASGAASFVEAKPWGGVGLHVRQDPLTGTPVNVGWLQDLGQGSIRGSNKYKVRVDLARGTGSLVSSGVYVVFYNASNGDVGSLMLCFGTAADTSGVVSAFGDGRRVWEQTFTAPATATKVVIYAMQAWGGFGGAAQASTPQLRWFECSISHISSETAGVTELREALSTGNSSLARLLLSVNTATNAATIEAAAFAGDGTWNGSAITLNADLIRLLAKAINFGTNTVFEDTKGTIYTTTGGKRIRMLGPFGSTNNLLLWYGASSIGINAETIANCDFCIATDGKGYYKAAELTTAAGPSRAKTGVGAASFSANSTWQTLGTVGYGDIPNPSTFSVTSIDLVGQSQSGVAVGSGYEWRVVHAPAANFSDVVVLRSGTFTVTAGGGGDPPEVSAISTVNTDPVAAARYGAVNCFLQIQRTSGTATVGIQGTLNVTSILP